MNSVKYNKRRGWNIKTGRWGGGVGGVLFVYFDPNDVNISKLVHVRTKL